MNEYGEKSYWDNRYKIDDSNKEEFFEWLQNYENLKPLLEKFINKNSKILNIGCGNSSFSNEMYEDGYFQNINIDISEILIEKMKKYEQDRPGLIYKVMDAKKLDYKNEEFDVVIDKSTLDAILCSENQSSDVAEMINEIQRVLKVNGYYIIISHGSPENRMLYLKSPNLDFQIDYMILEKENYDGSQTCHFMYIAKKGNLAEQRAKQEWEGYIKKIKIQEQKDKDDAKMESQKQTQGFNVYDLIKEFKIPLDDSPDISEEDYEMQKNIQKAIEEYQSSVNVDEKVFLSEEFFQQQLKQIEDDKL